LSICTGYSLGYNIEQKLFKYVKSLTILKHKNFTGALELGYNRSLVPGTETNNSDSNQTGGVIKGSVVKNDFYAKLAIDSTINSNINVYADLLVNGPDNCNDVIVVGEYKINQDTKIRARVK
jgi:hypothetical protein